MTIISPLVLSFYTEVKSVGKRRSLSQGCTWLVRVKASPYSKVWDFRDALTKLPASGRGWAWAICHLSLRWEIVLVCSGCTTQYHRLGGLSHRNLFYQFWRLDVQDQIWTFWFPLRLGDGHPLAPSSQGYQSVHVGPWCPLVCPISSSLKDTSQIGLRPPLRASF